MSLTKKHITDISRVHVAATEYANGNYAQALEIYKQLGQQHGQEFFIANIWLCRKHLGIKEGPLLADLVKQLSRPPINPVSSHLNSSLSYQEASRGFYHFGKLKETQIALNKLLQSGENFDRKQREFRAFVDGLIRLQDGVILPPRQPNPGLSTRHRHVLYCLHQSVPYATNGYATRSHGVAVGLQNAGWKVRATTRPGFPWDTGAEGLCSYHTVELDGITYAAIAGWDIKRTPLDHYLAEAADHYLREAQTSGAEIIIAASNHITALPALMAARRLGLPFVYEVRGLWEVTQASTNPEWANSGRYYLMRTLEQQAAREADLVITLTEELADELASWGVKRKNIVLVPNAVDTERFTPQQPDSIIAKELNLKPGVPVIGYAGSAVAYEGLELLLDALALLKQQKEEFTFVLVGDGKVIEPVKQHARKLGIENLCRFTGRIPFEQVPRYLSCMDIMPIPRLSSAVTEMVSALKPLEAMAMGKAVVLSDVSPHKTMAGTNERARLFRKNDVQDLAQVLCELIHNQAERSRLGVAGRKWAEQERSWDRVSNDYALALQQLINKRTAPIKKINSSAKQLDQITLGLIADQFTTDTLASAVKVIPLSPANWRQQLANQKIDAIFVESAWKGNNGQWHCKVGYYSDAEFTDLAELLAYCRIANIPSLFWNKEDPVHFDRFRRAASLCDHVFTTDSRRIIPYLRIADTFTKTASSCPFYASPKIHNLLPSTRPWQPTVAYGGTYYGKRYPERTEYMDKIMSAAAPLGLTIYDRQHADPASPYKYPSGLGNYVEGDLSYADMIQAYKAHPVQINVNSVLDSPTMFSRRVVEAAACGTPLVSGPALGMNRYLEGAAHVIHTESQAAQALENLLRYPAYRWRNALRGARAVMRAHTTGLRLTQMLRTAGMCVAAPQVPQIHLLVECIDLPAVHKLLAQTLRPHTVVARQWNASIRYQLEQAGIQCCSMADSLLCQQGQRWLLATSEALEQLEAEDIEDLAWVSTYAPQPRIAYLRDAAVQPGEWPGVALETDRADNTSLRLLKLPQTIPVTDLNAWAAAQTTLALRKPFAEHDRAPNTAPQKTLLIAGHDLKFIQPFYPYFAQSGIRILLDFWTGHNQHNSVISQRLLEQADIIFCEWMLGNAIWYGTHKKPEQKLVGRLHAQELRNSLFDKLPFNNFEKVIFVGPHILRQAKNRNPVLKKNGVVIYNGVDVEALQAVPRRKTNGKVLGFVGMVPQSKRLDLALDILRELRKGDTEYTLRIKGKRPEEYSWMANRPEEMAWYEEQYRRINEDKFLKDAVFFDPHGNDMPEWYAGIDYVLSTSDFESFHFTIADGAAAGCVPIIFPWEGADEIYPKEWVFEDVKAAVKGIKNNNLNRIYVNEFCRNLFEIKSISERILQLIKAKL